jgi:hypothetical protein
MPLARSPTSTSRTPVRLVIADHVVSADQLEILLLLRLFRDRWWTVDQVNEETRSTRPAVRHRLEDLARRRLVVRSDAGFRYGPPLELAFALAELASLYAERQTAIAELIFPRFVR